MPVPNTAHYYRFRALSYNHRGGGFLLSLREEEDHYRLRYQTGQDRPRHDCFREGQIDPQAPFIEKRLSFAALAPLIQKIEKLSFCLPPPLTGGFDGISQHLWIENGMSWVHLSWWLDCPEPWQSIDDFWQALMQFKPE